MQVQILHGNYLSVSAAGSTAFNTEAGAQGRLSECNDCLFPKLTECLSKSHAGSSLSLSRRRRIDCRDKNQLTVFFLLQTLQILVRKLCLIFTVKFQVIRRNSYPLRNFSDRFHFRFLCNFNICLHSDDSSYTISSTSCSNCSGLIKIFLGFVPSPLSTTPYSHN